MSAFVASYPFSYAGNCEQERVKGVVQLATGTTYVDFQTQLASRVNLPVGALQVVIACSRANEFDQLQKIPIHEGTNFNVILTQHNPARDKNVHFIVTPKMSAQDRVIVAQRKAMEAARADEDAAARLAAGVASSPRSFASDSIMLGHRHSGSLSNKVASSMMPQHSMPNNFGCSPPPLSKTTGWKAPGNSHPVRFQQTASPTTGGSRNGFMQHGSSAPSGGATGPGVLSYMLQKAARAISSKVSDSEEGDVPKVTPFPEGMLRAVHAKHSSCNEEGEVEFWRTSPRDRMVMGFRGPSPFGAVGSKIRVS